jgi:hypothetical protein
MSVYLGERERLVMPARRLKDAEALRERDVLVFSLLCDKGEDDFQSLVAVGRIFRLNHRYVRRIRDRLPEFLKAIVREDSRRRRAGRLALARELLDREEEG